MNPDKVGIRFDFLEPGLSSLVMFPGSTPAAEAIEQFKAAATQMYSSMLDAKDFTVFQPTGLTGDMTIGEWGTICAGECKVLVSTDKKQGMHARMQVMQAVLEAFKAKQQDLEKSMKSSAGEIGRLKKVAEEHLIDAKELRAALKKANKTSKLQVRELELAAADKQLLEGEKEALKMDNASLVLEKARKVEELSEAQLLLSRVDEQIRKAVDPLHVTIAELQRKVSEIPELQRKVSEIPELQRKVSEIPELHLKISGQETKISSLDADISQLTGKVESLSKENVALRQSLKASEVAFGKACEQISYLNTCKDKQNVALEKLEQEIVLLKSMLAQ